MKFFNWIFLGLFIMAMVLMIIGSVIFVLYRCSFFGNLVNGSWWDGYVFWKEMVEVIDLWVFCIIYFGFFVLIGVFMEFYKGGRIC